MARLRAKIQFSAWGKDYAPNQVIPATDHSTWPEGTVARRVESGDAAWEDGVTDDLPAGDGFDPE